MPSIALPVSLRGQLLNSTRIFNPVTLFAANEPGVWYDPSDLTTLFQDTAGTTPVTTPGQTVALALDKSKGLVLGPELVINGDFSAAGTSGWVRGFGSVDGTFVNSGGVATYTLGAGDTLSARMVYTLSGLVSGNTYRLNFTSAGYSGTGDRVVVWTSSSAGTGGTTLNQGTAAGWSGQSRSFLVTATATTMYVAVGFANGGPIPGGTVSIDNISVRELPGFHATQATAASRPTYGIVPRTGRRNLLTFTSFEGGVAGTPGTTPTGFPFNSSGGSITSISDGVISLSATAARQIIGPTVAVGANQTQVWRVRLGSNPNALAFNQLFVVVNSAGLTSLVYYVNGNPVDPATYIPVAGDILSAVLVNGATPLTTTVFRIGVGASTTATGSASFSQPQAELGPTATAYQRVGSAFDVTEAGVPSLSYLSFDGVDDFLVTPTITPGVESLGSELVTNGDFSVGTGWTLGTGVTISGGVANLAAGSLYLEQGITTVAGRSYKVTATASNGAFCGAWDEANRNNQLSGSATTRNGTFSFTFTANDAQSFIAFTASGAGATTIDNVSVREVLIPADKMTVVAGVRKLSDAAQGMIAEMSANSSANAGSFFLIGPRANATANYGFNSRGTVAVDATSPSSFASPVTNVLTGIGDISGDIVRLRVNGSQVAETLTDQGTGNFLAYPLYIGRRGGTTLPFNGQLYSLIVRFGANLDAGTITSTETWVNGKTGAYA